MTARVSFKNIKILLILGLILKCLSASSSAMAAEVTNISYLHAALAPNAGGQDSHSLKLLNGDIEYSIFVNEYIRAGGYPLSGAVMEWVSPICEKECWGNLFLQYGGGASLGGPVAHLTWSAQFPLLPLWLPVSAPRFVPQLRIDFTSQFILLKHRAISWSYPLWLGLSIPF